MDSNHRRHCQQIYSLSPLATREFPHIKFLDDGAGGRTRTPDLLITKTIRSVQTLIYQRFWAFPLDPNVLSRPVISVVSIRFFRDVVHGVGRDFSGGTVVVPGWVI